LLKITDGSSARRIGRRRKKPSASTDLTLRARMRRLLRDEVSFASMFFAILIGTLAGIFIVLFSEVFSVK